MQIRTYILVLLCSSACYAQENGTVDLTTLDNDITANTEQQPWTKLETVGVGSLLGVGNGFACFTTDQLYPQLGPWNSLFFTIISSFYAYRTVKEARSHGQQVNEYLLYSSSFASAWASYLTLQGIHATFMAVKPQ